MASNPVIHFEIGCTDTEGTRAFFDGMFDWDIQALVDATAGSSGPPALEGVAGAAKSTVDEDLKDFLHMLP